MEAAEADTDSVLVLPLGPPPPPAAPSSPRYVCVPTLNLKVGMNVMGASTQPCGAAAAVRVVEKARE